MWLVIEESIILPQQQAQLQDDSANARSQDIERISKSVHELADLFTELQQLVLDQGTLLDRVDYNIEQASQHIKHGAEQLHQGADYQRKDTQKRMALLVFCVVVLLAAIIFIFFLGG